MKFRIDIMINGMVIASEFIDVPDLKQTNYGPHLDEQGMIHQAFFSSRSEIQIRVTRVL